MSTEEGRMVASFIGRYFRTKDWRNAVKDDSRSVIQDDPFGPSLTPASDDAYGDTVKV